VSSREELEEGFTNLKNSVGQLDDARIKVQLAVIIAKIGDSHTGLGIEKGSLFPFSFYWFSDGIFVLAAAEDLGNYLGWKLAGINGNDIESVCESLAEFIPHENDAQLKSQIPAYLVYPEVLYGLGIIPTREKCEYALVDSEGKQSLVMVNAIQGSAIGTFAKNMKKLIPDERPDSYWETSAPYWRFHMKEEKTMLVNYNSCRNSPDQSFAVFTKEVFKIIDDNDVSRLIIDLRQNGGGNSMVFNPMLKAIKDHPRLNREGRLFVLIGRRTFSSAILNSIDLRQETEAIFIGEPTGGKPNHFGEVKSETLKNSGLQLYYSTKYFKSSEEDTDSFMPDHEVSTSFDEYMIGLDMAFELALSL